MFRKLMAFLSWFFHRLGHDQLVEAGTIDQDGKPRSSRGPGPACRDDEP